jgi:Protein of unknown function (DUF2796)
MKKIKLCALPMFCLALMGASLMAHAHEEHAHVHGVAQLDVLVLEEGKVTVALETPLDNVLGFEHQPRTQAEKNKYQQVKNLLTQGAFFEFDGGQCRLLKGNMQAEFDSEEAHADLDAEWTFECKQPNSIKGLSVGLFKAFPRLNQLQVQTVLPSKQFGAKLTPTQTRLSF